VSHGPTSAIGPVPIWPPILQDLRAVVGLPDIRDRVDKTTGTWRFTYTHSLALDSANIVTVEELEDGSARLLVTTENPVFQVYRAHEYERQWICGLPKEEQAFLRCPIPGTKPDVD
jgi:hypothetical protein